jgi:quinol monooxygenase YgiN
MSELAIDPIRSPERCYRIDSFTVPDAAREAFVATMQRNLAFIRTLDGFRGHTVFEKRDGDSSFNLVTIAAWEDRAALERAKDEVRAYLQRSGLDLPGMLRAWGVRLVRADYSAPAGLQ